MSNTPSDVEIIALADETRTAEGGANGYILPISFARAVLAKWGTPQPVVREPLTAYEIHEAIKAFKESENLMGVNHIHVARASERAHGITQRGGSNAE